MSGDAVLAERWVIMAIDHHWWCAYVPPDTGPPVHRGTHILCGECGDLVAVVAVFRTEVGDVTMDSSAGTGAP